LLTIRGGTIVTMNGSREVIAGGDLVVADDGSIASVGARARAGPPEIDARGKLVLPGLVQTHVHLCQTLYRNRADDLDLLAWLKERIWPYEAALDPRALRASARLGIAELLRNGTTTLLDMGTVRHYDEVFLAAQEGGIRLVGGKCLMDDRESVPANLLESSRDAIDESLALAKRWHGRERLLYALAPRFVLSCTEGVLRDVAALSAREGYLIHTHASEQAKECAYVRERRGDDNIAYLDRIGIGGPRACLAHCVHATPREIDLLAEKKTRVLHCPSSNLKLGSGIAPVPTFLAKGISVSLGCDGAPCNNLMDPWEEMRLAALLQKPLHGPVSMPALTAFELATIGGARALGLADRVGSLEPGKRADVIVLDPRRLHAAPSAPDVYSQLVYATRSEQVETVLVDGAVLVSGGKLARWDEASIRADAEDALARTLARI
jgi:cytosine/adenosine deaminase-related metal-dependent hydrolase